MASQTGICNMALTQVGHETVAAIDNSTKQGRVCLAAWPLVLDALLEEHAWGFATKRVALQQLSDTPAWGYDYAYKLPANCIRLLEVYPDSEYSIEAGDEGDVDLSLKILSDEEELSIKYIYRVAQTGLFPPWFTLALADALAFRICFPLEGSATKREALGKTAELSKMKAIAKDCRAAYQDPGPDDSDDSWLTARGASSDTEVLTIEA